MKLKAYNRIYPVSKKDFKLIMSGYKGGLYSLLLAFHCKLHNDVKYLCDIIYAHYEKRPPSFLNSSEHLFTQSHLPDKYSIDHGWLGRSAYFVQSTPYFLPSAVAVADIPFGDLTPQQEIIRDCIYSIAKDVHLVEKY